MQNLHTYKITTYTFGINDTKIVEIFFVRSKSSGKALRNACIKRGIYDRIEMITAEKID